ncbi:MAG: hypothetical protein N3G19_02555 [Candidatus Pacearchaeota archaeon]|nr:hypothetical protein [Candidatus Pacearchaeota archaeon]
MAEEKQKEQKQEKIAIDIKRVIPIFADNVIVANLIKANQKSGKLNKKDGNVNLIFVDSLTHQAVSRIVVSKNTAEALLKALDDSLKRFDKEIKNKEVKSKIETISDKGKSKYLG